MQPQTNFHDKNAQEISRKKAGADIWNEMGGVQPIL